VKQVPDSTRASLAQRLALYLDPASDEPLYRQIVNRLWLEVVTGTLETGERLPTVRQLAIDLSLNPNTVARAYNELEALGVLTRKPGQGTFVSLSRLVCLWMMCWMRSPTFGRRGATPMREVGVTDGRILARSRVQAGSSHAQGGHCEELTK
jgi:DNA-binding transcriptional MocR family regulator